MGKVINNIVTIPITTYYYREQTHLKGQLITADSPEVRSWRVGRDLFANLHHVGGVDISFVKGSDEACAMLVVLSFPELKVHTCRCIINM